MNGVVLFYQGPWTVFDKRDQFLCSKKKKKEKERKSMIRVAMIFQDVRGNNTAACTYSHTETCSLKSAQLTCPKYLMCYFVE